MNVSKNDIIAQMRMLDPTQSRAQHTANLDTALTALTEAFLSGNGVTLSNFGNFKLQMTTSRKARNPRTGEMVDVPAQHKLTFKPAPVLKAQLNGK